MDDYESAADDAQLVVAEFTFHHRAAAIPALIGACVLWAVENGGADLVRGSLEHAIAVSHEMEEIRARDAQ